MKIPELRIGPTESEPRGTRGAVLDVVDKINQLIRAFNDLYELVVNKVSIPGAKGDTGAIGLTGPQGTAGPQGPQGNQGLPGLGTVIGNLDGGEPGSIYGGMFAMDGGTP